MKNPFIKYMLLAMLLSCPMLVNAQIELVDLGLSVKWADRNIDAMAPSDTGGYYAWGETMPKDTYSWATYTYCSGTAATCEDIGEDISRNLSYDRAYNFNATMWLPTAAQWEELISQCTWTATTVSGVKGYNVKGPSGKSIFLPFSGCSYDGSDHGVGSNAYYWTANNVPNEISKARAAYIKSGSKASVTTINHSTGAVIRAVGDVSSVAIKSITLGTKVLMMKKGETVGLSYSFTPDDADVSTLTWTTSNGNIASVSREGAVSAHREGTCTVSVSNGADIKQECVVVVDNVAGTFSGHEYVDLGLPSGTLWATTNVGADTSGETGTLFSWVETEDDAAHASWGAYWRMPTQEQLEELIAGTSLVYTSLNDTEGFLLTSLTNGKCIFLPVTISTGLPDRGCYWSGTSDGGSKAYALNITSTAGDVLSFNTSEKLAIRPVYDESVTDGSTFTVSTDDLDFGSVAVGDRRSMSFNIHNNTFGVINVQPFGIDADDFIVDWTGGEIQPNASQSVTVTYSPTKEVVAAGGSLRVATAIDSSFVNVAASSHKGSYELTSKVNLVVWCKNGAKVNFLLNDKPIVMIKDGKWKIDSKKASAEYDVADVVKMTYDGIPEDIPAIDVGNERPFALDAEALTFLSDSEDLHVRIVASSGVIVRQFVVRHGTASSVPLNQFAPGVYIVSVNNISHKISIR